MSKQGSRSRSSSRNKIPDYILQNPFLWDGYSIENRRLEYLLDRTQPPGTNQKWVPFYSPVGWPHVGNPPRPAPIEYVRGRQGHAGRTGHRHSNRSGDGQGPYQPLPGPAPSASPWGMFAPYAMGPYGYGGYSGRGFWEYGGYPAYGGFPGYSGRCQCSKCGGWV
jgi:hypothetical protein